MNLVFILSSSVLCSSNMEEGRMLGRSNEIAGRRPY